MKSSSYPECTNSLHIQGEKIKEISWNYFIYMKNQMLLSRLQDRWHATYHAHAQCKRDCNLVELTLSVSLSPSNHVKDSFFSWSIQWWCFFKLCFNVDYWLRHLQHLSNLLCNCSSYVFHVFLIAAFAPMNGGTSLDLPVSNFRNQPFDTQRYFPDERDWPKGCEKLCKEALSVCL